jgi:hypothetical protein
MDTTIALIIALFFAVSVILARIAPTLADKANLVVWAKPGPGGWHGTLGDGSEAPAVRPSGANAAGSEQRRSAWGHQHPVADAPMPDDPRRSALLNEIFATGAPPKDDRTPRSWPDRRSLST